MPFGQAIGQAAGMMNPMMQKQKQKQKQNQGLGPSMGGIMGTSMGSALGQMGGMKQKNNFRPRMDMNPMMQQMGSAFGKQRQDLNPMGMSTPLGYGSQMTPPALNPDQDQSFGTSAPLEGGIGPQPQMLQEMMKRKQPQMGMMQSPIY